MNSDRARQQAENAFKQRARSGQNTMTDYEARSRDIREKIKRLRAIRFANQAQEQDSKREKGKTSAENLKVSR